MKVIVLSLILMTTVSLQACRTCYYYDQHARSEDEETCTRPYHCDPTEECCTNGPTYELEEDYYSPNN